MLLSSIPVVYNWWTTPADQVYTGVGDYSPIDLPVYFADIKQVEQGHLLVHDLFTTEGPQQGMFHVLWVVLGAAGQWFHQEPWVVFHVARVVLVPFLIWCIWFLAKSVLPQRLWKFATILTVFGSGTGTLINSFWHQTDLAKIGLDYWVTEGFTFMTILQSPHFVLSLALFLLILALWWRGVYAQGKQQLGYILGSGLVASVLFSFHPFHIFDLGLILITHLVILLLTDFHTHKSLLWLFPLWLLCAAPGAVYQIWLQWGDPVLAARSFQSKTPTPSWATVYLCFPVLWLLSMFGAKILWKKHKDTVIFLWSWGIVQTLALFSPIEVNRRFIIGLPVAFLFLSAAACWHLMFAKRQPGFLSGKTKVLKSIRIVAVLVPVFLLVCFSSVQAFTNQLGTPDYIKYISQAANTTYTWIEDNTLETDTFLDVGPYGLMMPAKTGRATYVAHWHESLFWLEKKNLVQELFSVTDAKQAKSILKQMGVQYVVLAPNQDFMKPRSLVQVFEMQGWRVYKVL